MVLLTVNTALLLLNELGQRDVFVVFHAVALMK